MPSQLSQTNQYWLVEKISSSSWWSEEWLTFTVVIKIRYSTFDTETKQCKIAHTSRSHIDHKNRYWFITKYTNRTRQDQSEFVLVLVRGTYQINLFEDKKCCRCIAMDKKNESRIWCGNAVRRSHL
jgi:hypothetical protein